MYRLQILEELHQYDEALAILANAENENRILDLSHSLEYKARFKGKLGMHAAAAVHWRELIDINPDNIDYYRSFLQNQGICLGEYP
jgi:tetratricopeptide (TPR) repeat protein